MTENCVLHFIREMEWLDDGPVVKWQRHVTSESHSPSAALPILGGFGVDLEVTGTILFSYPHLWSPASSHPQCTAGPWGADVLYAFVMRKEPSREHGCGSEWLGTLTAFDKRKVCGTWAGCCWLWKEITVCLLQLIYGNSRFWPSSLDRKPFGGGGEAKQTEHRVSWKQGTQFIRIFWEQTPSLKHMSLSLLEVFLPSGWPQFHSLHPHPHSMILTPPFTDFTLHLIGVVLKSHKQQPTAVILVYYITQISFELTTLLSSRLLGFQACTIIQDEIWVFIMQISSPSYRVHPWTGFFPLVFLGGPFHVNTRSLSTGV